jgi:excisionase family DNA binding protein
MNDIEKEGGENSMGLDTLYTIDDVIKRYNLAKGTLYNWVSTGKIPYLKVNKKVLFPARELAKWEKQRIHLTRVSESEQK